MPVVSPGQPAQLLALHLAGPGSCRVELAPGQHPTAASVSWRYGHGRLEVLEKPCLHASSAFCRLGNLGSLWSP